MLKGVFYHYTGTGRWLEMRQGTRSGKKGLYPMRRFIKLGPFQLPDKAFENAAFGLTEPLPQSWIDAEEYEGEPLFKTVLKDMEGKEIVLLKVTVLETDDVHLADWSHHLNPAYLMQRYENPSLAGTVKRAYYKSLRPFFKSKAAQKKYKVPEVICFSPIPLERIEVIKTMTRAELEQEIDARNISGGASCRQHPASF